MNVGDYVRTKNGYIDKIKAIDEENHQRGNDDEEKLYKIYQLNNEYYDEEYNGTCDWVFEDFIIKSSPNIIDLIEVGDYVNGKQVIDFMLENGKRKGIIVDADIWGFDIDEIKSIVTREMFESMEYKVGE